MKRFINSFFIVVFAFICCILGFGCDEKTFSDIPYKGSDMTVQSLISKVDATRSLMINTIKLPVKVKTTNTYKFYNTTDEIYHSKVIKDEISTIIGKTTDNPSVAVVVKDRYVDDVYESSESTYYVIKSDSTYMYNLKRTYNSNSELISEKMSRSSFSLSVYNFLKIYNDAVGIVYSNQFDEVLEKNFDGIKYYKLVADVIGINNVNNGFDENSDIYNSPTLFSKNDYNRDFVKNYTGEFGLKANEGYDYITYSTVNYDIYNDDEEKYLNVSSLSKLTEYGDSINARQPEDIDLYTARTFVDVMKSDNNYIVYTSNLDGDVQKQFSVSKVQKTIEVADAESGSKYENIYDYSIMVDTYSSGASTITNYYYMSCRADGSYVTYKLDLLEKTCSEVEDNSIEGFDLLEFNFDVKIDKKDGNNYQFVREDSYIDVVMSNNEVSKVIKRVKGSDASIEIKIVDYGFDYEKLNLVTDIDDFRVTE